MYSGELIGKKIVVVKSTQPSQLNIEGVVLDETKNSLVVDVSGKNVVLLKKSVTFKISRTGEIISGLEINKRSVDRVKGK